MSVLIDKSWTKLRNRCSPEFLRGLNEWMEYAKQFTDSNGQISCPCKRCLNNYHHPPDVVYAHVHDRGFDESYNTWIFHGECYPEARAAPVHVEPIDEMADIINDFLDDDNLEDTSDDIISELLSNLQEKLYPGCQSSSLHFLAQLMHIKVLFNANGGMLDIPRARQAPLPDICYNRERWESFINQYTTELAQKRSNVNIDNRKMHKFPSTQGRKSMPERRYTGVENPETEPPSKTCDEVWEDIHKKPDGTWVNDAAQSYKDEINMHKTQLSQEASQAGESPTPLSPMQQIELMARVFKPGRAYTPGVGPRLPSSVLHTPTPSSPPSQNSCSRMISEDEHNRRIEEIVTQKLNERLQHLIPILRLSASTSIPDDLLNRLVTPHSPRPQEADASTSIPDDDDVGNLGDY